MGVNPFYILTVAAAAALLALAGPAAAQISGDTPTRATPLTASPEIIAAAQEAADVPGKIGQGAKNYVESMGRRALGFLGNGSLSHEQKKAEFRTLLQDSYDLETIGRFALGRYWRSATPAQRSEYLRLFKNMVVRVYSQRFEDYQGQKFETRSFRVDGEKDTIVTSFIVPTEGPEVQVDWRVRYKNGRYQIVDVIVEGVSMSVTQRSDFSSVIQRGGGDVQVLIDHLRQQ
jgi:phospholipid transport system substrate-binding protein